jgi:hypothetical protein
MIKAKRKAPKVSEEKPRLINILAELCQCDPAAIEWDGEGSSDTIAFNTGSNRYLLKLARESVQGSSASVMDFRVRVLIT